jgi:hypothetical protein
MQREEDKRTSLYYKRRDYYTEFSTGKYSSKLKSWTSYENKWPI